jgi:tetratricopeptide (TPR) repeat protein
MPVLDVKGLKCLLSLAVLAMALTGCSAMGVPASSDPATKLAQARALQQDGRFLPARNLLAEVLQIYQTRGDQTGIAETYRQLGLFYQRPLPKGRKVVVPDDFNQTRYETAMNYFEQSLALYEKLNDHALVSNVRFLMARTYHVYLKDDSAACSSFAASRAAHLEAVKIDPSVRYTATGGYKTFEEQIAAAERYLKCEPNA